LKTTISIFVLFAAIEISNVIQAQVSATNTTINQTKSTNDPDQAANTVVTTILDMETNYSSISSNGVVPLIQFQDVPLNVGLEEIIKQTGLKIEISSRIIGSTVTGGFVEFDGVVVYSQKIRDKNNLPDSRFVPMPNLSMSWKNITTRQALIALCQNYNLIIIKDSTTGLFRIEPKELNTSQHLKQKNNSRMNRFIFTPDDSFKEFALDQLGALPELRVG
jgi:hypothetical protein